MSRAAWKELIWKEIITQALKPLMLIDMLSAKKHIDTLLRALSMNKRRRDRTARPNRPSLTLTRQGDSLEGNRAALEMARRGCSKSKENTDSSKIHRITCARRRKNDADFELVCRHGRPGPPPGSRVSVRLRSESDKKAHNDCKAKVCVREGGGEREKERERERERE